VDTVAGKKLLITGAAMGMGRLYAQLAVKEKAGAVVLWDVNQVELEKTAAELKAQGGGAVFIYVVDVSKLEAITAAAEQVRRDIGDIDILFNNAGIVRGKYFWDHDPQKDIWMTMAINALAPMYIAREFLPAMIRSGRECRVVNIASAAGLVSNPKMSVYCGSKWAATGWSDSVRLELEQAGHRHVRVLTVNPTYISTGMFAGAKSMLLTPILTPEHVVGKVWNGMKKGRARLILPWTVYIASALKGILPLAIYDFIANHIMGIYRTMEDFKGRDGK